MNSLCPLITPRLLWICLRISYSRSYSSYREVSSEYHQSYKRLFKCQPFVKDPFPLKFGDGLHFVFYIGPQLLEHEGHWRSLPDYESSKEQII
jgi:hypothetical protein